jgi:dihydroxyacetone kinase
MDAVAGDGDHGRGMVKGADAALAAATATLERGGGAGAVLVAAGDAWAAEAGGTSGVLWGAGLRAAGATIDDDAAVDACVLAPAAAAAAEAIRRLGKAQVGDKTLVDALAPFVTTVELQIADGADAATAWWAATEAAEAAAAGTARLRPQLGRARPLAERSVGTPDPGATSLALCARAVGTTPTTKGP